MCTKKLISFLRLYYCVKISTNLNYYKKLNSVHTSNKPYTVLVNYTCMILMVWPYKQRKTRNKPNIIVHIETFIIINIFSSHSFKSSEK